MADIISLSQRRKARIDALSPNSRVRAAAAHLTTTSPTPAERAIADLAHAVVGVSALPVLVGVDEYAYLLEMLAHDTSQLARGLGPRGQVLAEALDALSDAHADDDDDDDSQEGA